MTNFDGTGPQGKGPKTGRGLGPCNTKNETLKNNPQRSRNANCGRGMGLGRNSSLQNNA
ncbi:MAG: DUF5320 domain-containing protein [Patescibacteria group bacterium]